MNKSQGIAELFDVGVLFDSIEAAKRAFAQVFRTEEPRARIQGNNLIGLAEVWSEPLPSELVELHEVGDDFALGAAFVGVNLGVTPAHLTRQMLSDPHGPDSQYPDPWSEVGRMREASWIVGRLLQSGATGVVLLSAGGVVREARRFLESLRGASDPNARPSHAWLDFGFINADEGGQWARSWGMMRYHGSPDVYAFTPTTDMFCAARAMQAVKYTCARVASVLENPYSLQQIEVPTWYGVDDALPPPPDADGSTPWRASLEDGLRLRCDDLIERDIAAARAYAETFAARVGEQLAPRGFSLQPAPAPTPPNNRPRVLAFTRPDQLTYRITAGMGRIPAAKGEERFATAHAEFALFAHAGTNTGTLLEKLGLIALRTPVAGGFADWNVVPPSPGLMGYVAVPMQDVELTPRRLIAVRQFVPISAEEYAQFRALGSGEQRKAWYQQHVPSPIAAAERWQRAVACMATHTDATGR